MCRRPSPHRQSEVLDCDPSRESLALEYWLTIRSANGHWLDIMQSRREQLALAEDTALHTRQPWGARHLADRKSFLLVTYFRKSYKNWAPSAAVCKVKLDVFVCGARLRMAAAPAFRQSLTAFKLRLSTADEEKFVLTTFEDLKTAVKEIQQEQVQRRGYRNLTKIKPFLVTLQQYALVIEQFVNAKSDFLAFIWVRDYIPLSRLSNFD